MELTLPDIWSIPIGAILSAAGFLIAAVWAASKPYNKIMQQIAAILERIEHMEERNTKADIETEAVKIEQAAQKTTVAVMAERMQHQTESIKRIEDGVQELLKVMRSGK